MLYGRFPCCCRCVLGSYRIADEAPVIQLACGRVQVDHAITTSAGAVVAITHPTCIVHLTTVGLPIAADTCALAAADAASIKPIICKRPSSNQVLTKANRRNEAYY